MKKKTIPNPSTNSQPVKNNEGKPRKKPNWHERYFCLRSWRERPVSDEFLEEIGKEFYDWCYKLAFEEKDLKPYSLTRWRTQMGIPEKTLIDWRRRNEKLEAYIKEGISMLGLIREQGLLTKQFSEKATMYSLPNYLSEWKKSDEYHDERKSKTLSKLSSVVGAIIEEVDLDDKNRETE